MSPLQKIVERFYDSHTGQNRERLACGHILNRKQDRMGHYDAERRRCFRCVLERQSVHSQ